MNAAQETTFSRFSPDIQRVVLWPTRIYRRRRGFVNQIWLTCQSALSYLHRRVFPDIAVLADHRMNYSCSRTVWGSMVPADTA